ncbi:MAG: urea ABC transporter permease subunit UrtB [Chromatiales bacterium]|nr:urea ABC transporter permease subunit UrtB [Chromatiales bacterium]
MRRRIVIFLLAMLFSLPTIAVDSGLFDSALELLKGGDFDAKEKAIADLAESGDPRTLGLLEALYGGDLWIKKDDQTLLIAERDGREYKIRDALTGTDLGVVKKREIDKIKINNTLRDAIKSAIATINLSDPDPKARTQAVNRMLDNLDPDAVATLRKALAKESDPGVKELMELAVALGDLKSDEKAMKLAAIEAVGNSLHPEARNRLRPLTEDADADVAKAAKKSLKQIEFRVDAYGQLETVFFGLSLGSVLVLAAIGLAITFGVMGVINMAHGELIMLGAYTTYLIQQAMPSLPGVSLFLSLPAAFIVAGLVGIVIERSVIRFLYGRPLETLLATFGISLILQQLVRTVISPQNVPVSNPEWMSGTWEINAVLSLTYNRLYIFLFSLLVFAALYLVLKKTSLGLQVRAVSQNRAMARAMGVRSQWVDAMTFGLGSGVAGVAGVALSQLTNVGPNLGQSYIIDSFMVVVFGGVGNLWGTLVAGLSLGVANKVLEPWAGAVLAKILVLVFIILFIQKRPRGLFPQKGRAVEG